MRAQVGQRWAMTFSALAGDSQTAITPTNAGEIHRKATKAPRPWPERPQEFDNRRLSTDNDPLPIWFSPNGAFMSTEEMLTYAARWLHILSATLAVGVPIYVRFVLM